MRTSNLIETQNKIAEEALEALPDFELVFQSNKDQSQIDFQASLYGRCESTLTLIFVKTKPAPWLLRRIAFRNQPEAKKVKYCVFLDRDPQTGSWVGPPVLC